MYKSACFVILECEDSNRNCEGWANHGYCMTHPDYMLAYCKRSCDVRP